MAQCMRHALDHADFATIPLAAAGCVAVIAAHPIGLASLVGLAAGATAWTLVEYAVHRALHDKRFPRLRRLHMAHHQHPEEVSGGTLYSSAIILALLGTATALPVTAPSILGVFLGYFTFIVLHHAEHHAEQLLAASPMRWIAEHHHRHHHNRPRGCFGVTTSVWDRLFGTL